MFYILIFVAVLSYLIYSQEKMKQHKEEFKQQQKVIFPTVDNPFMNIMRADYREQPDRESASKINEYLLSKGIAVRYLLSYGLPNALRITFGTKNEISKTLEILKEFINNNG